jgi:predicted PurR-regulated permease PerM
MSVVSQSLFWGFFFVFSILVVWVLGDVLTPFILGIAIAYLLNPLMVKLTKSRVPRWGTALFILILFFSLLTLAVALLAPLAVKQAQMLIDNGPAHFQAFLDYIRPHLGWIEARFGADPLEQFTEYLKQSGGKIAGVTGGVLGGLASGGKAIFGFIATLIITPLVAFFMMKDWPHIVAWVEDLYPRRHETVIRRLLKNIDGKIAGFIRGQITVAFCLGLAYAIALSIVGLNYGFLIGLGTGLFLIIPFVGSTLGLLVGVTVAWFQTGDMVFTGLVAAIFALGQFIEGNFITPKIIGDSVGLHPLWIMFALMAGGSLFGIVGMLIAVPVAAMVSVLGGFAIEKYKESALYRAPKKAAAGTEKK